MSSTPSQKREIKSTTCYMCACRCGINVTIEDGEVRFIQGNPEHPINKGVLCAKGASGIMKQYSPARLTKPLRRRHGAERGKSDFEEISWEEALSTMTERLQAVRDSDAKKFALYAGRDQMQALTGLFAKQFGTPNYAAHGVPQPCGTLRVLSREVIVLPLTMVLIFGYAILKLRDLDLLIFTLGNGIPIFVSTIVGFVAVLAVCTLFICTAMIYACLKFLRQWHSPLTVVNFFLLGCASGFTLATSLAVYSGDRRFAYFVGMAMFLTLVGMASRFASLSRNRSLRSPSTLQSAIGVHHPNIRQTAQGAMGGSFNTRAFIHGHGPFVLRLVRRGFIVSAFILPLALLLAVNEDSLIVCLFAFLLQYLGLLVERWFFFIEAEHPQNVYYQMIS